MMTEQEERDWTERLRAAVAKTIATRVHKRQMRAEMGARRDVGLQARHASKLNRKD